MYSDRVNVNENVNVAIAFERIAMKIGCFHDTRLVGSVAFMRTGPN